jgi:hypothetical protein
VYEISRRLVNEKTRTMKSVWAAANQVLGKRPWQTHGGIMRIRRNIIAPLILTIGAVGSLAAVPAVTALTAATPAAAVVAAGTNPSPDFVYMG